MKRNPPRNFSAYVKRYQAGSAVQPLARECGVSQGVFRRWLSEAGVTIRGRAQNGGNKRTPHLIASARALREGGCSYKQIANRLNISVMGAWQWVNRDYPETVS